MLLLKHFVVAAFCLPLLAAQTFEAASVKPSGSIGGRYNVTGGPGTSDPGRITYTSVPLRIVVLNAYDVKNYQLTGPDWINTLRYDIAATLPAGTTKDQYRAMLRNLLESRFQITLHRESKELPIYSLLPAKKGLKIKPVAAQSAEGEIATASPGTGPDGFPKVVLPSPGVVIETKNGTARITAKEVSMSRFADFLATRAGRPVFDQTGLDSVFSFVVYFTPEGARTDDTEPDLFAALQEQLGLRLEEGKGPVEMLVIDHAEKTPTAN